jgi:glycosyltransferase involved in cell wall biosynthesis
LVEVRAEGAATGAEVSEAKLLVVVGIPAFEEEKTIARVVLQSKKYADKVVVCDDGSSDLTGAIAESLGADVVRHERNLGYGAAIRSLFKRARELDADVLVTLDGDGQHDPAEVPRVIRPVIDGQADIVVGSRFVDELSAPAMQWYRRAGVKFITRLANAASSRDGVRDAQSGFRAYDRRSLNGLVMFEDGMGVSTEILINARRLGLKVCEVPCSCSYDDGVKTSTHNPVRHGANVVASIIRLVVEEKPLVTLGIPGIVCLFIGCWFGAWMLQLYAVEKRIVTNVALASMGFVMIGFFCLSTAITLYAISRSVRRTNSNH